MTINKRESLFFFLFVKEVPITLKYQHSTTLLNLTMTIKTVSQSANTSIVTNQIDMQRREAVRRNLFGPVDREELQRQTDAMEEQGRIALQSYQCDEIIGVIQNRPGDQAMMIPFRRASSVESDDDPRDRRDLPPVGIPPPVILEQPQHQNPSVKIQKAITGENIFNKFPENFLRFLELRYLFKKTR